MAKFSTIIFLLFISCQSPAYRKPAQLINTEYVDIQDYLTPAGKVYCYADSSGEIKKYELIQDLILRQTTDYDSSFRKTEFLREFVDSNGIIPQDMVTYLKSGDSLITIYNAILISWKQPLQSDSTSAHRYSTTTFGKTTIIMKTDSYFTRINDTSIQMISTYRLSATIDGGQTKEKSENSTEVYVKGVGEIYSYSPEKYKLVKILSPDAFMTLKRKK